MRTAEQFNQNKEFVRNESLEKQVEEALDPTLQMIPTDAQHNFPSSLHIVFTGSIVANDSNKQSAL